MNDARQGVNYTPAIFDVRDVDEARRIILTAEAGTTTDERWAKETPWLAERILDRFPLTDRHVVIDFGCGLGRMAKVLIERTRCWVVGVDMSQGMRQLAPGYVQSAKFAAVSPPMLDLMMARGFRAELAIAIWVLQHVPEPDADVRRLQRALVPVAACSSPTTCAGRCPPIAAGRTMGSTSRDCLRAISCLRGAARCRLRSVATFCRTRRSWQPIATRERQRWRQRRLDRNGNHFGPAPADRINRRAGVSFRAS